MADPNERVNPQPATHEVWLHERYGRDAAAELMRSIATEKRTGSLTINFSQGAIGNLEWRQRARDEERAQKTVAPIASADFSRQEEKSV